MSMAVRVTDTHKASEPVRLSLKVPAAVADTIKSMAKERNTTVTRVIRDAIETEQLLQDAKRKRSRFFIEDENGGRQRELIIR
jgi:predicted transcriptional regulator